MWKWKYQPFYSSVRSATQRAVTADYFFISRDGKSWWFKNFWLILSESKFMSQALWVMNDNDSTYGRTYGLSNRSGLWSKPP